MSTRATAKTSTRQTSLERGRQAFRNRKWGDAFSRLSDAARESPLGPQDLVLLAQAAQLTGRDTPCAETLARAHQAFLECEQPQAAARCAFWLGFSAMTRGEPAKAGGWLARASRLLEDLPDCAEKGYLALAAGYRAFQSGDLPSAQAASARAIEFGRRFRDADLMSLALQGHGRALIRAGEIERGVALLDEAMVAVAAGEVSPLSAGGVYCSVLDGCGEIFDLRRAQEWTFALDQWCASQPDLVPFRGHCLIRRSELLQLHGDWQQALECAERAAEWMSRPAPKPGLGAALYQIGEIHRVSGRLAEADRAYADAMQWMRCPGPGVALLRLAQGKPEAAAALIRSLEQEVRRPGERARVLDVCVEIALAEKDTDAARVAASELSAIAAKLEIPFVDALSSGASGAVALAVGDARDALRQLKRAGDLWRDLQAPYEAARIQCLTGVACRASGDEDSAAAEFASARRTLERLGAVADLARLDALVSASASNGAGPLTEREVEVLRLVAAGLSNRSIATRLFISEKTVARHISNIFIKLDLSSRTAAAAYAFAHHLI